MAHAGSVLALLLMLWAPTIARAQEAELPVSEVAPGIFVHTGVTALMTRENEGAIANVGFVIGDSAVASSIPAAASAKGGNCSPRCAAIATSRSAT